MARSMIGKIVCSNEHTKFLIASFNLSRLELYGVYDSNIEYWHSDIENSRMKYNLLCTLRNSVEHITGRFDRKRDELDPDKEMDIFGMSDL